VSFQLHVERRPQAVSANAATANAASSSVAARDTSLPLVCLHGWGMNLRVFDLLRDALAADCETWAVDLAGHGRSPWSAEHASFEDQVEDVLRAMPARCVLLGWSFGGKIALEIAARNPQRVAALVLTSVSPRFSQSADWPHGMDVASMRAFREVLEQDWQQTLRDFVWLQLRGSRNAEASQQIIETALAEQGAPRHEALLNGLWELHTQDLRPRVAQIAQPVLIISGQNDRVTSPAAARWLAQALPQSQLLEIPRAGHAPFVSHHVEVAAATREFLRTVRPARTARA
jgi:pimeloyl-[acyl-carrier protein] methyl ester esterase